MKKLLLFALLSLLILNAVSAYDTWIYAGDSFEYENAIMYVEKGSNVQKILLYVDDYPYIIALDECKKNYDLNQKYCIEEAAFEDPEKFDDKIKYEFGEELFGYHLFIYDLVPELSIEREIRPDVEVDKISSVTVTLTNEGEEIIKNIVYQENISYPFRLIDGYRKNNLFIYELPSLGAGQSREFRYEIIPDDYISDKLEPIVTYVYDNKKLTANVDPLSITLSTPLEITRTLTSQAKIDEEFTYKIVFKNKENSLMKLRAELVLPEELEVINKKDYKFNGKYIFESSIDDEETAEIILSAPLTGNYQLKLLIDAEVNDIKIAKEYYNKIDVVITELVPTIQLSRAKISESESGTIRFYLENNGLDTFNDLKIDMKSDLFPDAKKEFTKILTGQKTLIKEISFIAPTPKNYPITFSGTYLSKNGELFSFEKTAILNVVENNQDVVIVQLINQTSAYAGDKIKVTVKLKNQKDNYVFVESDDSFSTTVTKNGKSEADITLQDYEERTVYVYEITMPEEDLMITTVVKEQDGAIYSANNTIKYLEPVVEEQEETVETVVDTQEVTINNTEKKGFFSKVWNWFVDFFK